MSKMKSLRGLLAVSLGAASLLASPVALAENKSEVHVAVVDVQRAISETNEGARANFTLKQLFDKRQVELNQKQDDLFKEKTALEKRCKAKPDQARCQGDMEVLQKKLLDLQNLMMQYQQEIQKKQGEATQPILTKMLTIVRRIAQRDGYDLIVDRTAAHYMKSEMDVTDVAIKMYNTESNVAPLTPAELKERDGGPKAPDAGKGQGSGGDRGKKPQKK